MKPLPIQQDASHSYEHLSERQQSRRLGAKDGEGERPEDEKTAVDH